MITRKRPSEVIRNHTHLIVICGRVTFGFLDHYYCDGGILFDYIRTVFAEENLAPMNFPKYTYSPFVSEAMAIQFFSNQSLQLLTYPSQIRDIGLTTRVLSKFLLVDDTIKSNRWTTFAVSTLPIFDSMPHIDYLRVVITVGFDTDRTFCNNRIGVIPIIIARSNKSIYNQRIADLSEQFRIQVTTKYMDAHTSYDILRSYDTGYAHDFGIHKYFDVILTSFYLKSNFTTFHSGIGGFVGAVSQYPFLYINAMVTNNSTHLTYVSNLKQMNYDTLVNDGMTVEYEFDNNDPTQF